MSSAGEIRQLALETFLTTVGPALVKEVAMVLQPHGIPIMPLKGVLLQKLVYRDQGFRQMSDVDILVPENRFYEGYSALKAAGFSRTRWEPGGWQVVMTKPAGPPLGVDLHRLLSRTPRSHLSPAGLFERGTRDTSLFGAPVILPAGEDLLAHLLLHATLHFITSGKVHRSHDFAALATELSLDPDRCAEHLRAQGLTPHALLIFPRVAVEHGGHFLQELLARLRPGTRTRFTAVSIEALCAGFAPGRGVRRFAGLLLAPSLSTAVVSALRDRLSRHDT